MILELTTDKLQLVTGQGANIECTISWMDAASATLVPSGAGTQTTNIQTATTTDVLAAPAANTRRTVLYADFRNKHASVACDVTPVMDRNGTDVEQHKVTLQPGEVLEYVPDLGWFHIKNPAFTELWKVLTADAAGQNVSTAQPWFPTAGGVSVEAGKRYYFEGWLYLTRAAGATSHTTGIGFGGTATITDFLGVYQCGEGDVATLADDDAIVATTVANLQVKAASTATTEVIKIKVHGVVTINAAGTFIPQFTYSAAPGGAPTCKVGSLFRLRNLAADTQGSWS